MILRKIKTDDKETWEEISFKEAIKLNRNELIFTSEHDKEKYDDFMEKQEDEQEEQMDKFEDGIDELEDAIDELDDKMEELDDLGFKGGKEIFKAKRAKLVEALEKLKKERDVFVNSINKDVEVNFEFNFSGDEQKLYSLLPFLGKEKVEEIVKEKIASNPKYEKIEISYLFPFISMDTADKLFYEYLKDESKKDELPKFAPYISKTALDYLCNEFCEGHLDYVDINRFYMYMSKDSINKIFDYYLSKQ